MDTLDLSFLSDKERRKIQAVLERDAQIQKKEEQRLERLRNKAEKTKNPIILKKIRMRSGQWFSDVQSNSKFKRRGVDTVRQSIRLAKSRRGSRVDLSTISPVPTPPTPQPAEPPSRLAPPPAALAPVIEQEQALGGDGSSAQANHIEAEVPPCESHLPSNSIAKDKVRIDHLSGSLDFLRVSYDHPSPGSKNRHGSTQSLNLLKPKHGGSTLSLASVKSGIFSSAVSQVTGSVRLGFTYNNKRTTLQVLVVSCSNLAAVDKKLSNPYVKTYLMPDKAKTSKRKTKIKKRTINPDFNETLKYKISESELATRVLNVGVWHDKVGYNVFLGEVNINMDEIDLSKGTEPQEYELKPKGSEEGTEVGEGGNMNASYNGEIEIALRFQPDHPHKTLSDSDVGQLDAVVKKVKNVSPQGRSGQCNLFIKGYFLPDRYRQTKQKSPVIAGEGVVTFDHLFSYTNVEVADLKHRCLELRVFDQSKLGAHRPVGGIRIGCGSGQSLDQEVEWMDSDEQERSMWDGCLASPGSWIEGTLDLRKLEPRANK